jgi:Putative prokaryotic signal transducing protein
MVNGFATVAAYRDVLDAQLAMSKLESEGIECSLVNEYLIGVLWKLSTAVGGVQVQVARADFERARTILATDESASLAAVLVEKPALPYSEACPQCGSEDVRLVRWSRYAAALATLTNIPIPFWRTRVKCQSCGKRWRPAVA